MKFQLAYVGIRSKNKNNSLSTHVFVKFSAKLRFTFFSTFLTQFFRGQTQFRVSSNASRTPRSTGHCEDKIFKFIPDGFFFLHDDIDLIRSFINTGCDLFGSIIEPSAFLDFPELFGIPKSS